MKCTAALNTLRSIFCAGVVVCVVPLVSCGQMEGLDFGETIFTPVEELSLTDDINSFFVPTLLPDTYSWTDRDSEICLSPRGITYLWVPRQKEYYSTGYEFYSGPVYVYDKTGTKIAESSDIPEFAYFTVDTIAGTEYLSVFTGKGNDLDENGVPLTDYGRLGYERILYQISGSVLSKVDNSAVALKFPEGLFQENERENRSLVSAGGDGEKLMIMTSGGIIYELLTGLNSLSFGKTVNIEDSTRNARWMDAPFPGSGGNTMFFDNPSGGYMYIGSYYSPDQKAGAIVFRLSANLEIVSQKIADNFTVDFVQAVCDSEENLYTVRSAYHQIVSRDKNLNVTGLTTYPYSNDAGDTENSFLLAFTDGELIVVSGMSVSNGTSLNFFGYSVD